MKDCPHCLKRNTNDASYCWNCGKRLDEESIKPLLQTRKCPNCGEEIQDEAVLCRYCQYDLPDTTPTDSLRAIEKSTIQEPDEATTQIVGKEEVVEKYSYKTTAEDTIFVGLVLYGIDLLGRFIETLISDIKWVDPAVPPSQVIGSYIFVIIPSIWLARKIAKNRNAYLLLTIVFSEIILIVIGIFLGIISGVLILINS